MPDVQLIWSNKNLLLQASGESDYEWIQPGDDQQLKKNKIELLTSRQLGARANVLAIGDGLDVLEALKSSTAVLESGIRLVYIDPPFNTQGIFRQYNDAMQRPMWLSMMRDRLQALRPLLAEDASVWVHLDDTEVHRARLVMDEVFGEDAFVTSVIWQKKTTRDSRAAFSSNHDTILVYAPSGPKKWKTSRNLLIKDESHLRNRDDDPRGPWTDAPFTAPGYRKAQQYEIVTPTGVVPGTRPSQRTLICLRMGGSGFPKVAMGHHV
jgi:adenine-specific DNA-methyltransferase